MLACSKCLLISLFWVNLYYLQTGMTVSGGLEHMCMVLMETITGETGLGIISELKLHGKQSKNLQIYKCYFKML